MRRIGVCYEGWDNCGPGTAAIGRSGMGKVMVKAQAFHRASGVSCRATAQPAAKRGEGHSDGAGC